MLRQGFERISKNCERARSKKEIRIGVFLSYLRKCRQRSMFTAKIAVRKGKKTVRLKE